MPSDTADEQDLPPCSARVRRMCQDHRPWSNADIATWFGVDPQAPRNWRRSAADLQRGKRQRRHNHVGHLQPMPPPTARYGQAPVHDHGDIITWGVRMGLLDRFDGLPTDPRHRARSACADPAIRGDVEALQDLVDQFARQMGETRSTVVEWVRPLASRYTHVGELLDRLRT